ncbi:MAG TPA: DUF2182 domain-containing protein [Pseudolabrys sp.]|nr:DUF2182 domain-containing protein [Pseudolabrys sp.]
MTQTALSRTLTHLSPAANGLGQVFAHPRAVAVVCVVALTGLGWAYLALTMAQTDFLDALCRPSFGLAVGHFADAFVILPMWMAMTLAMMLPSAAPMIFTYAEIADTAARKGEHVISPFVLTAGYAAVWLGFALIATLMQLALMRLALLDASMRLASVLLSGAIFIGAGAYQFSSLKQACLRQCQSPFPFFFANWSTKTAGVFRLGLRQGLYCVGCCWASMLVMFAVGAMNALWMAGIGIAMTVEKMTSGMRFSRIVGTALIVAGGVLIVVSVAAHWPQA